MATRTIAIVNPNNGPVTSSGDENNYKICINYLRSKGVKVVGYVHTKLGYPSIYGYRPYANVVSDIDVWHSHYTVDGIFVDEVTNNWPNTTFDSQTTAVTNYGNIVTYITSHYASDLIVLNPGGPYYKQLVENFGTKVIAVLYEDGA